MSTSGNHGNQPRPLGTIVVIGRGFSISFGTDFGGSGMRSEPPSQHASIGDDFSSSDTDKNEIEIKVEFERPLTDDEKKALDDLAKAIAEISRLLSKLPADARIKLSDGKEITGQELKDIWSRTDFFIDEKGTPYRNQTDRGEADYNGGNPRVRFTIETVSNYARLNENSLAGTNYIALHELAHMTAAGRASNQAHGGQPDHSQGWKKNESLSNDVAHALLVHAGLPTLPIGEKQGGLSNPPPQVTLPSTPDGGGGGGGGGGHDHQVIH